MNTGTITTGNFLQFLLMNTETLISEESFPVLLFLRLCLQKRTSFSTVHQCIIPHSFVYYKRRPQSLKT